MCQFLDLLNFLRKEFEKSKTSPFPGELIIDLIKFCFVDSKLVFNNTYCSQTFGMAMGNPLSPALVNLFKKFFERNILVLVLTREVVWLRYVYDDMRTMHHITYRTEQYKIRQHVLSKVWLLLINTRTKILRSDDRLRLANLLWREKDR